MYKFPEGIVFWNRFYNKAVLAFTVLVFLQLLVMKSGSPVMAQENKVPAKDTVAPWQVLMKDNNPLSKPYLTASMAQGIKVSVKDTLAPWQVVMNEKNPHPKLYFKGMLILDGKVIRNGGYTLDTISVNSIRSISVIKNVPAADILKYGEAAKEGIIIVERN